MDASAQVADYIRRTDMLPHQERVVVGVSGGPDSLCILDVMHGLGYPVVIGHLDHQLRPESGQEARYVRKIAKHYGVRFFIERADVRSAAGKGRSLEDAARLKRYDFLVRVAKKAKARYVAVGHTADDQAETVLMHLLRGAGPAGLRGMLPRTSLDRWIGLSDAEGILLIRPLLEISRRQTEAHCQAAGLQPMEDASNLDQTFFRNRLRHELLPLLESYNPGIRGVLCRTGKVMADVSELLEDLTSEVWPQAIRPAGNGVLAFQAEALKALPVALQRSVVRRAILELRPECRDIGYASVASVLSCVEKLQQGARHWVVGGLELQVAGHEVVLRDPEARIQLPAYPQLVADRAAKLKIPGNLSLANGWQLEARLESISESDRERLISNQDAAQAALDAERLPGSLEVRSLRPGERIRLLGMQGSTKISALFVNLQIPQPARAYWPLIVADGKVVWVVGLRMAHDARLTPSSRKAVLLRVTAPEGDR
ncbi:MAG: tRNA lysidine(34) synthetase TilS [Anaerolineales bacterium]|jgi:tRNA(Ile)-lysidine synthase